MFVINEPLVKCASAEWYGQVKGSHSTRYLVVREGQICVVYVMWGIVQ